MPPLPVSRKRETRILPIVEFFHIWWVIWLPKEVAVQLVPPGGDS